MIPDSTLEVTDNLYIDIFVTEGEGYLAIALNDQEISIPLSPSIILDLVEKLIIAKHELEEKYHDR